MGYYKARGKSVSVALPNPSARREAEREISEFRRFQESAHRFVQATGCVPMWTSPAIVLKNKDSFDL
jgi:hypothetical protein